MTYEKKSSGTLKLGVTPFVEAIPPQAQVIVSSRNIKGKEKIRWKLANGYEKFEMHDLLFDDPVFKNKDVDSNKITCDFDAPDDADEDKEYPYTLVVKDESGTTYDTTDRLPGMDTDPHCEFSCQGLSGNHNAGRCPYRGGDRWQYGRLGPI